MEWPWTIGFVLYTTFLPLRLEEYVLWNWHIVHVNPFDYFSLVTHSSLAPSLFNIFMAVTWSPLLQNL